MIRAVYNRPDSLVDQDQYKRCINDLEFEAWQGIWKLGTMLPFNEFVYELLIMGFIFGCSYGDDRF